MMGTKEQRSAVIMGDLVKSESSLAPALLHEFFNMAVDEQNKAHKNALLSPLTITLGDEFQGLAKSLASTAAIARDLRLKLLEDQIECRFVIGIVDIQTPININKAWNMMGPGLARAREKLNQKKADQLYRFSLEEAPISEALLDAIGAGLTTIERSWTNQQREDITALIKGMSPSELAKRRNVSVHSIYKVRGSGNFDSYIIQWNAINEALEAYDKQGRLS